MRELDNRTISELGIPAAVLMENAGKACAERIAGILGSEPESDVTNKEIVILCGTGNNGGDGFVIARWLHVMGYGVVIYLFGEGKMSPESEQNYQICCKLDLKIVPLSDRNDFDENNPEIVALIEAMRHATAIVDAIYGNGFRGELRSFYLDFFDRINASPAIVFAIDIPSGLSADTGFGENAVIADYTLVIECIKYGHLISEGRAYCGSLLTIPIGIPQEYYDDGDFAFLIDESNFEIPERYELSHKGLYGRVEVIAGSVGFTGAATLACQAALHSGAGYVILHHRPELSTIFEIKLTEVMTSAFPISKDNSIDIDRILESLQKADCILIGPGLGLDETARKLVRAILNNAICPVVVDADAITILASEPELLPVLGKENILLTPHVGEFCRLAGIDKTAFYIDWMGHLTEFVQKYSAQVLLKSWTSIYCDPINTLISVAGNDGLSTGGSGDVLSGIIASFLAQNMTIPQAAINASWLLGSTAERLAKEMDTPAITPTRIIKNLFI